MWPTDELEHRNGLVSTFFVINEITALFSNFELHYKTFTFLLPITHDFWSCKVFGLWNLNKFLLVINLEEERHM